MSGRVVIVGGGIVGLCTARALVRRGHRVTLAEAGPVPNPRAASADHHRLIRYAYPGEPVYCRRIAEAHEAWRALFEDLPRPSEAYYAARGILTLSQERGDWGDRARETMAEIGIEMEEIGEAAEIARRFPFLEPANIAAATLTPGGALMANRILADLADWLRGAGVALIEHAPAVAIDAAAGCVRLADGRALEGDRVVLAAGTGLRALCPELMPDLRPSRTVMVYAAPPADLAEAWEGAPCWTDLGGHDDLWGMPPLAGLPAKLGCGALGRLEETDDDRRMQPPEIAAVIDAYRGRLKGIDRFEIRSHQANYWVLAPEERFQLRREGRLVALSACSGHGFKFGALTGEDAAAAVSGDEPFESVAERLSGRARPREIEPA